MSYDYFERKWSRERIQCASNRIFFVIFGFLFIALGVMVQTNFQVPASPFHLFLYVILAFVVPLGVAVTLVILYHLIFTAIPAFYDWIRGY